METEKLLNPLSSQAARQRGLAVPAFHHWRSWERFLSARGASLAVGEPRPWLLQVSESWGRAVGPATSPWLSGKLRPIPITFHLLVLAFQQN